MNARWRPTVGRRVYDTGTDQDAVVTDILSRGLPRPVYVLRADGPANSRTWETDQPSRLRPVEDER